jgi:hypothetical protein
MRSLKTKPQSEAEIKWPKKEITWIEKKTLFISIPFTWNLPRVKSLIQQKPIFSEWRKVIVGGPAVKLIPDFFSDMKFVSIRNSANGVLQKINPLATKTSIGCIRKCKFCAVPKIEGNLKELSDWPDLPIVTDNNLLACSKKHFNKVINRLKKFNKVDFNQGIDGRLLKKNHAMRFAELKNPTIRLALDNMSYSEQWEKSFNLLRNAGLPKNSIRSYALIGYDSCPEEAWKRCEWIERFGIKVLPMWYHALDQLKQNIVTEDQQKLGWSEYDRKMIMGYFYRHRFPRERRRYYE